MVAYWVARSKINDPVQYKRYTDQVPAIIEKYQARVLSRGAPVRVLEGPERFNRFVIVEFPSMAAAIACHESPEYRAASSFRRNGAGEVELVILDAGEFTPI